VHRRRSTLPNDPMDLNALIEASSDPSLPPERHAEMRSLVQSTFGPYAETLLRSCTLTMAARREAAELREQYERVVAGAQLRGIVTAVQNGRARVLIGGTERVLVRPDAVALGVGQTVLTDAEGRALLAGGDFLVGGQTYGFCERLEGRHALVRPLREALDDGARQLALVSEAVDLDGLVPDDRVLGWSLDNGNVVLVTRRLGPPGPAGPDDVGAPRTIARADIVGLDEILERIELLFLDPPSAAYEAMLAGASGALRGVVLQGTAGCGKTLVADYFISQVRARGGRALYRMASHYLSKWVGEGAAALRADFALLDAAHAETGVRPLIVIDELEAIALGREHPAALTGGHLDVLDTLLGVVTKSAARMIGISNVADRLLDTALTRDGRLPVVRFPPTLTPEQTATLVARCLTGVPLVEEGR
jgi:ATPase family associated with various cellular activities (AAA)